MNSNVAKRNTWKSRIKRNNDVQERTNDIISIDSHCHEIISQLFLHAKSFELASYQTSVNCRQLNIHESAHVLVACEEVESIEFNHVNLNFVSNENQLPNDEPLIIVMDDSIEENIDNIYSINAPSNTPFGMSNSTGAIKPEYIQDNYNELNSNHFVNNEIPPLVLVNESLFEDNAVEEADVINVDSCKTNIIGDNDYTDHCFVVSSQGIEIPKVSPYVWQSINLNADNNILEDKDDSVNNGTIFEDDENQLEFDLQ